ncbi:MAG: hypothetical protein EA388_13880 [Nitriliruptor sp.]|nr:MAG: hypothetical protein EA388_13880 [Nitriliruptor sp.]
MDAFRLLVTSSGRAGWPPFSSTRNPTLGDAGLFLVLFPPDDERPGVRIVIDLERVRTMPARRGADATAPGMR